MGPWMQPCLIPDGPALCSCVSQQVLGRRCAGWTWVFCCPGPEELFRLPQWLSRGQLRPQLCHQGRCPASATLHHACPVCSSVRSTFSRGAAINCLLTARPRGHSAQAQGAVGNSGTPPKHRDTTAFLFTLDAIPGHQLSSKLQACTEQWVSGQTPQPKRPGFQFQPYWLFSFGHIT